MASWNEQRMFWLGKIGDLDPGDEQDLAIAAFGLCQAHFEAEEYGEVQGTTQIGDDPAMDLKGASAHQNGGTTGGYAGHTALISKANQYAGGASGAYATALALLLALLGNRQGLLQNGGQIQAAPSGLGAVYAKVSG